MNENFKKFLDEIKAMPIVGKGLYEQYYLIKNASKVLKELENEINQLIVEEMVEGGEIKKEFEFGNFTMVEKTTWEYESPEIFKKEKEIKEIQKQMQEDGTANKIIKSHLLFK